jgi:uncharacterized protein YpmB
MWLEREPGNNKIVWNIINKSDRNEAYLIDAQTGKFLRTVALRPAVPL